MVLYEGMKQDGSEITQFVREYDEFMLKFKHYHTLLHKNKYLFTKYCSRIKNWKLLKKQKFNINDDYKPLDLTEINRLHEEIIELLNKK